MPVGRARNTGTQVQKPQELQEAVESGDVYIEITEHLDLRRLSPSEGSNFLLSVGLNGTISIRGHCTEEPNTNSWNLDGEALAIRALNQCVLVTDVPLLEATAQHLWLHNVLIRHQVSERAASLAPTMLAVHNDAEGLWLTDVTVQGQGVYDSELQEGCMALLAEQPAYLEGAYLLHLGGSTSLINTTSTVAVVNSRVQNNSVFGVGTPLLHTSELSDNNNNSSSVASGGAMWLRGSLLSGNEAVLPLVAANTSRGFYSDAPREYFSVAEDALVATIEPPGAAADDFLSRDHPWFKDISENIPGVVLQTAIRDQVSADASVTAVGTALALQGAVRGGARHIRVTQHSDLRELASARDSLVLGAVSTTSFTIQGRCEAAPGDDLEVTGEPLRDLLPEQCVFITDRPLLAQYYGRLWLDNIYIRLQPSDSSPDVLRAVDSASDNGGEMWVTRTTIQGDGAVAEGLDAGQPQPQGLTGIRSESLVYAHGVDMANLGGNSSAAAFGSAAFVAACTFTNNTFPEDSDSAFSQITAAGNASHVWLQDVTLDSSEGPMRPLVSVDGGSFYSAVPVPVQMDGGAAGSISDPVPPEDVLFLSASDPWIVSAAAEVGQHIVPFEDLPTGSSRSEIVATGAGVAVPRGTPALATSMLAPAPAPAFATALTQDEASLQDSASTTERGINIPWWIYAAAAALLAVIAAAITIIAIVVQRRKRARMHELHAQQPALDSSLATSEPPSGQYGESLAASAEGSLPILGRPARTTYVHPTASHGSALAVGSGTATGTHSHSSSGISSVTYATAAVERFEHGSVTHDAAPQGGTLVSPMVPGLQTVNSYNTYGSMHASHARSSTQGSTGRKGMIDWPSEAAPNVNGNGASLPSAPWLGTTSSKAGSDHIFNWSGGRSVVEMGSIGHGRDSPLGGVWGGSHGRGGAGGWGGDSNPWVLGSLPNASESILNSHTVRNSVADGFLPPAGASATRDGGSTKRQHSMPTQAPTAGSTAPTIPLDGTPSMVSRGAAGDSTHDALIHERKAQLGCELDHLRTTAELFLGKYVVLSMSKRREGGQGVVQFMRSAVSEEAVAVKFFLSRSAFEQETALYSNEVLKGMMPATREVVGNSDGSALSSRGRPWPPFIVLEKGESLQEWAQREEARYSTIMDALNLITEKLAKLHASGWVHRDLKPGNVLRLPSHHSWTLMDFGCAAEQGADVPIMCSLAYAPPEVVQRIQDGEHKIKADKSADLWALGVIAFELLTGTRVFSPDSTCEEQAVSMLCGLEPLPWEEGAVGSEESLRMLKGLRGMVLRCLDRDPNARPTADGVQRLLTDLFEASAGISQFDAVAQPAI